MHCDGPAEIIITHPHPQCQQTIRPGSVLKVKVKQRFWEKNWTSPKTRFWWSPSWFWGCTTLTEDVAHGQNDAVFKPFQIGLLNYFLNTCTVCWAVWERSVRDDHQCSMGGRTWESEIIPINYRRLKDANNGRVSCQYTTACPTIYIF